MSEGERENKLREFLEKKGMTRKAFYPGDLKKEDSIDPRITKFGGKVPRLPTEEKDDFPLLVQLYVPSLPEPIQDLFQEEHKGSLIVVAIDSEDLGYEAKDRRISVYTSDQLDQLVYSDSSGEPVNEPRIVCTWEEGIQYPNESLDNLEYIEEAGFSVEDLSTLNEANECDQNQKTYLGGWPQFTQSDDTPTDGKVLLMQFEESDDSTLM